MLSLFDVRILQLIIVCFIRLLCVLNLFLQRYFVSHVAITPSQMHQHLLVLHQGGYKLFIFIFLCFYYNLIP